MFTLHNGDCLEYDIPPFDVAIVDPPYGTGERLRVDGEFVNTIQEWDVWDTRWLDRLKGYPLAFFCPPQRIGEGMKYANRLLAWISANPIAKSGVSPRYGIQSILARGPFPVNYGLDWFMYRSNIQTPDHPHQKPLPVMKWLIETMSKPNDVIFDPFMGSGSTGVAALQMGRRFVGCEISPEYFAIAQKRIKSAALQPGLFTPSNTARTRQGQVAPQFDVFE